jgi:hypothetical protein
MKKKHNKKKAALVARARLGLKRFFTSRWPTSWISVLTGEKPGNVSRFRINDYRRRFGH